VVWFITDIERNNTAVATNRVVCINEEMVFEADWVTFHPKVSQTTISATLCKRSLNSEGWLNPL
jgi:hypothetical protein